uniref:Uncharacterized protein n=1 Tax=Anser cygnoides TaxID=8845 RepID=A0A8B9EH63_ANSCY
TKRQLQALKARGGQHCGTAPRRRLSLPAPPPTPGRDEPGAALASPSSLVALIPVPTYSLSSVASILKRKMQACNQTCCHVFTLHLD